MSRESDTNRFYELLDQITQQMPRRLLRECHGKLEWPNRGVYFFYSPGECRPNGSARVVRIGTHGVSSGSRTTLWKRLSQHRGTKYSGGGNHRGSIFRRHVGAALLNAGVVESQTTPTWGLGSNAPKEVRTNEYPIEVEVSNYIGKLPFTWIEIDDAPSKSSDRSFIERNSIALLSCNTTASYKEPASESWLGHYCPDPTIQNSALWNVKHAKEQYDPKFLDTLEAYIARYH